jgi:hypothetical protein
MTGDFEDNCWMDIVAPDVLEVYSMLSSQDLRGVDGRR